MGNFALGREEAGLSNRLCSRVAPAPAYDRNAIQGEYLLKKWLVVSCAVAGSVVAVASITHYQMGRERSARVDRLAKLPQRERNLALYHAFCSQLEAHYYDHRFFEQPEWPKLRAQWREKAAAAENNFDLYMTVLSGLGQQFPRSHIGVAMPKLTPTPASAVAAERAPSAAERERSARLVALWASGPGFVTAPIRRDDNSGDVVVDVVAGSPADRAGIQPGWVANGSSFNTTGGSVHFVGKFLKLTQPQAIEFDKHATLTSQPATQESFEAFLAVNSVNVEYDAETLLPRTNYDSRTLDGGIPYVRFDDFMDEKLMDRALGVIDGAGPGGLILDLRRNSGGLNAEMHRLLGRLLGHHEFVGSAHHYDGKLDEWTPMFGNIYPGPIVILISPSTASAAEITAAAVQDHKRGAIVGRTSAGAVMSALEYPLPDGGRMMIPVRDFMRAGERHIEGAGVEPDIYAMPTLEDIRAGRDPALDQAMLALKKKMKK